MRAARAAKRRRIAAARSLRHNLERAPACRVRARLSYGVRLLFARPAFTAVAVITLALGIGANTAIFSVVHAMLLAPLPFPEPDRLVMLWETEGDRPHSSSPRRTGRTGEPEHVVRAHGDLGDLTGSISPARRSRAGPGLARVGRRVPDAGCRTAARARRSPRRRRRRATTSPSSATACGGAGSVRAPDIIGRTAPRQRQAARDHRRHAAAFVFDQQRHEIWVPIAFNAEDAGRAFAFVPSPRRG